MGMRTHRCQNIILICLRFIPAAAFRRTLQDFIHSLQVTGMVKFHTLQMLHLRQLLGLYRNTQRHIGIGCQLRNGIIHICCFTAENHTGNANALHNAHYSQCGRAIRRASILIHRQGYDNPQSGLIGYRQHGGTQGMQILPHTDINKLCSGMGGTADHIAEPPDQAFRRPFRTDVLLRIPSICIDEHAHRPAAGMAAHCRDAHGIRHNKRGGTTMLPVHRHHLCRCFQG